MEESVQQHSEIAKWLLHEWVVSEEQQPPIRIRASTSTQFLIIFGRLLEDDLVAEWKTVHAKATAAKLTCAQSLRYVLTEVNFSTLTVKIAFIQLSRGQAKTRRPLVVVNTAEKITVWEPAVQLFEDESD